MSTQYEILATIKSAMANNDEVVTYCEKQMAAIEHKREAARGRKRVCKPSMATMTMRTNVYDYLKGLDEDVMVTNKEVVTALNASFEGTDLKATPQGVSAALRYWVGQGDVERIEPVAKTGAATYRLLSE